MTLVLIRLLHVLLGVFWGGAVLFLMFFLDPATRAAGPAGGQVMQELQKRGFINVLLLVGLTTVLTGFYVLWAVSGGFDAPFRKFNAGLGFLGLCFLWRWSGGGRVGHGYCDHWSGWGYLVAFYTSVGWVGTKLCRKQNENK